jgi:hypothetical protein
MPDDRDPPSEIAEALENTTERVDVLGERLVELGDRAIELLPLLGLAVVVIVLFWLLARLLTGGDWFFRWIDNRFVRDLARHFTRIVIVGSLSLSGSRRAPNCAVLVKM